eukprot:scpid64879/ scgid26844/ Pre-mRNA-splicing factor SLU7
MATGGSAREDWKKRKELEEARKAGTAPAETDEDGRDINPHIPQYISEAPWYVSLNRPSLRHQRQQPEKLQKFDSSWYLKGLKSGQTVTKFRSGACENCGSMTHKKKDCLERPRKVGAKFSGENLCPDEHLPDQLAHDFDGKRDRWNGYDADDYQKVIEHHHQIEMAKRRLKAESLQEESKKAIENAKSKKDKTDDNGNVDDESSSSSDEDDNKLNKDDSEEDDEDKYADRVDMPGTKFDSKHRTTIRNLRIREDTAKYLYNLDPNSAHYDPKTRSMRDNPFRNSARDDTLYRGENFVRHTGEVDTMAHQQLFAWEAKDKGLDVHQQADPTKMELLYSDFRKKKENFKQDVKEGILEKYGGQQHLDAPPAELLLAQTENYVEYSRTGHVIKGQEKAITKSKYEEDIYINNHSAVYGSYWESGQWGFACCHSFVKMSYCTGEQGKIAARSRHAQMKTILAEKQKTLVEMHKAKREQEEEAERKKKKKKKKGKHKRKHSESDSEDEAAQSAAKLAKAIKDEKLRRMEVERVMGMDERKRPYNSMHADSGKQPTEEEIEAFHRTKVHADDPMANFIDAV